MSRQYFTANPALPHPDDDTEPLPMELNDAIRFAIKTLRDPMADQWTRNKAADELQYSQDTQDTEK